MKIFALRFSKENGLKVAALLSQYATVKTVYSFATDDFFSPKICAVCQASNEEIELMQETELKQYFINL